MDEVQYKYKPFNIEYAADGKQSKNDVWIENPNDDKDRTAAERLRFITGEKESDYSTKKVRINFEQLPRPGVRDYRSEYWSKIDRK